MNKNLKFFKSRLAKRFFGLFIFASLIPIVALALISYYRVTTQLTDQAYDRLRQVAKAHALDIYERLIVVEHRIKVLQSFLFPTGKATPSSLSPNITERNQELFTSLLVLRNDKVAFFWGEDLLNDYKEIVNNSMNLPKGTTTLMSLENEGQWPTVFMVLSLETPGDDKGFIIGAINQSFLWGLQTGTGLPPAVEFSAWDDHGRNLFSSLGFPVEMDHSPLRDKAAETNVQKKVVINNEPYYASSWSPFMKPRFHIPYWTIMVMEPQDHVMHPLNAFRMIFVSIFSLSLLIVILLTNNAIRRSLIPIDALMEAARKVAQGLFSHRVVVKSKDEFHDLAIAFNQMTDELDKNFKALTARSELDSAVLSVLDLEQIIAVCLEHSDSFIPHNIIAVSIIENTDQLEGNSYIRENTIRASLPKVEPFRLSGEEYGRLLENNKWLKVYLGQNIPSYLDQLSRPDIHFFIVFPVWIHTHLFALVSLGMHDDIQLRQRDMEYMREFVDHLSIAFANSNLIQELKKLNVGTLNALARTVDAKSSWTAGHSERVAQRALDIGYVLGLTKQELDDLQRAALLHDIGKIGTPNSILDKPGKLTPEEYNIIKQHPSLGATILSPIQAYNGIIPIVEQHHERYDGKGYPFGKSGEQIHLSARIMALADSFDAMISDRPYRNGLSQEKAISIIQEEAGHQFDPRVVEAFQKVIDREKGILFLEHPQKIASAEEALLGHAAAGNAESMGGRCR